MSDEGDKGEAAEDEDVLFVGGPADSGEGFDVLRKRKDRLEVGELRATKEGKPLHGELVKLSPRGSSKRVFDVETLLPARTAATTAAAPTGTATPPAARTTHNGPPQVATSTYRKNWDRTFGKSKPN